MLGLVWASFYYLQSLEGIHLRSRVSVALGGKIPCIHYKTNLWGRFMHWCNIYVTGQCYSVAINIFNLILQMFFGKVASYKIWYCFNSWEIWVDCVSEVPFTSDISIVFLGLASFLSMTERLLAAKKNPSSFFCLNIKNMVSRNGNTAET